MCAISRNHPVPNVLRSPFVGLSGGLKLRKNLPCPISHQERNTNSFNYSILGPGIQSAIYYEVIAANSPLWEWGWGRWSPWNPTLFTLTGFVSKIFFKTTIVSCIQATRNFQASLYMETWRDLNGYLSQSRCAGLARVLEKRQLIAMTS